MREIIVQLGWERCLTIGWIWEERGGGELAGWMYLGTHTRNTRTVRISTDVLVKDRKYYYTCKFTNQRRDCVCVCVCVNPLESMLSGLQCGFRRETWSVLDIIFTASCKVPGPIEWHLLTSPNHLTLDRDSVYGDGGGVFSSGHTEKSADVHCKLYNKIVFRRQAGMTPPPYTYQCLAQRISYSADIRKDTSSILNDAL